MKRNPYRAGAGALLDKAALRAPHKRSGGAGAYVVGACAAAAVLGASALVNKRLARRAERDNPPRGRFIFVRGVRLHVVERGEGEALVLLHGNGASIEDFEASGLIERAASRYRVIAIDRPGFGHSARPRGTVWTDEAQADLIAEAMAQIGLSRALVLGHSWGCAAAMALALNHPEKVSALVLVSGYYYPSVRADAAASAMLTIPVLGAVARHAIMPWIARAAWPLVLRKLFGPAPTPAKFAAFPKEMAVRPSQLGASAEDSALMAPDALLRSQRYSELKTPLVIVAGAGDRLVDFEKQSGRLHADIPHSTLRRVADAGHMAHHTATNEVMAGIDEAAQRSKTGATAATAPQAAHEEAAAS